jgi:tetratricopeptide (TPR) repeat protein
VGDGYNYVLLLPVRPARAARGAQIGDLFYATTGELLSESLGIATKLVSSPSETFLGKLFGTKVANDELVKAFKQVGELRQQNRLREAYDVLDQVQGDARNHRLILANTIQIAAQLDDNLYRAELKRLATYHKDDPRVAFTLLDHYFLENDLDSAMAVIDLMEQTYGQDAVFYIFRANVDAARGRFDSAAGYAEKAVQLEPGNEDAYWTMLTLLVQSGKFAESIEIVQLLESEFGYLFMREDFEAEPLYADFARSEEFARWIEAPGR